MNADESVTSGRWVILLVRDGHEALHRIDFWRSSAYIGGQSLFPMHSAPMIAITKRGTPACPSLRM
jgi:hypothetical protein